MFDLNNFDWEWLDQASCARIKTPDIFFPPRDKEVYRVISDEAKTYCFGGNGNPACPVRLKCLAHAISTDKVHGIWGGMSHRERNAFVRKWQRLYKDQMTLEEYIFQFKKEKD